MEVKRYKEETQKIVTKLQEVLSDVKDVKDYDSLTEYINNVYNTANEGLIVLYSIAKKEASKSEAIDWTLSLTQQIADCPEDMKDYVRDECPELDEEDKGLTLDNMAFTIKQKLLDNIKDLAKAPKWNMKDYYIPDLAAPVTYSLVCMSEFQPFRGKTGKEEMEKAAPPLIAKAMCYINRTKTKRFPGYTLTDPRPHIRAEAVRLQYEKMIEEYKKCSGKDMEIKAYGAAVRYINLYAMTHFDSKQMEYYDPKDKLKGLKPEDYIKGCIEKEIKKTGQAPEQIDLEEMWLVSESEPLYVDGTEYHPRGLMMLSPEMAAAEAIGVRDGLREFGYEEEAEYTDSLTFERMGSVKGSISEYLKKDAADGEFRVYTPMQRYFLDKGNEMIWMFESEKRRFIQEINKSSNPVVSIKLMTESMKKEKMAAKEATERNDNDKYIEKQAVRAGAFYCAMRSLAYQNPENDDMYNSAREEIMGELCEPWGPEKWIMSGLDAVMSTAAPISDDSIYNEPGMEQKLLYGMMNFITEMQDLNEYEICGELDGVPQNALLPETLELLREDALWAKKIRENGEPESLNGSRLYGDGTFFEKINMCYIMVRQEYQKWGNIAEFSMGVEKAKEISNEVFTPLRKEMVKSAEER